MLAGDERVVGKGDGEQTPVEPKAENTRSLPLWEFHFGVLVQVQNQEGLSSRRWTKIGRFFETMGNKQYRIRLDYSGRVTPHNRRFLRKISPFADRQDYSSKQPSPQPPNRIDR